MSDNSFAAKVARFKEQANQKLEAVYKSSTQDLTSEMTKAKGKGGNMPVDTGYLRASIVASLGQMPKINPKGVPPKDAPKGSFAPTNDAANAVIMSAKLEDTINIGFTAAYARPREYTDGFVRLAAQNWQKIVNENVSQVK